MAEIGWASLGVVPTFDKFGRELEQGTSKHMAAAGASGGTKFGDTAGRTAGKRFGSLFKTAAKASLLGLAGASAIAFKVGKDSIESASDLNESLNAVNVTYGKQARAVRKLGTEAATTLGLSNSEFNSLSVRFSAFAKTIAGGDGKKVVGTLDDLTTRASDFASVMNLEVNEAAQLFQSGLAGESEPLRKFGLDLSAAKVESFAYAQGIAEAGDKLTEAEKVQARYGLIMRDTAKTQGDFKNTSGELANQQRILSARWEDARAKLGTGLLPIMSDAAEFLLERGIPAFEDFSDWFNRKGIPAIQNFAEDAKPLIDELLPAMGDALGTVRDTLKPAAKHAKDLVGAFNDMPDWAKTAIVGGGASLLVGRKLGLGKVAGKAAGSLVGSAKPIPVFVTNQGFGPDGGVAGGKKGKFAKGAGPLAVAGGIAFLSGPLLTGDSKQIAGAQAGGAAGIGGARGEGFAAAARNFDKLTASAKTYGVEVDKDKRKTEDLANLLAGPLRVKVDDSEVRAAIRAANEYAQALRDITVASEGFNAKLQGDSYGGGGVTMNFNGLDLQAAKREMSHRARARALGGADFE